MTITNKNYSVFVIILNWNHKEDLIETMNSFIRQDYRNLSIVIVDNNSTDDSIEYVSKNFPAVFIIRNNENLGWAGGNNVGIDYCLKRGADFIILSNNDIYIEDTELISKIMHSFSSVEGNLNLGIYGVSERNYYDREIIRSNGWTMYPKYEKFGLIFNKSRKKTDIQNVFLKPVDFVGGFFMMFKKDVFMQVGRFDPNYFMYGEETDFSLRAWDYGYGSYVNTELTVYHKVAKSSGDNSAFMVYYQTRNLLYLIRKNRERITAPLIYMIIYHVDILKIILKNLLKKKSLGDSKSKIIISVLVGFLHSIQGKMGKRI